MAAGWTLLPISAAPISAGAPRHSETARPAPDRARQQFASGASIQERALRPLMMAGRGGTPTLLRLNEQRRRAIGWRGGVGERRRRSKLPPSSPLDFKLPSLRARRGLTPLKMVRPLDLCMCRRASDLLPLPLRLRAHESFPRDNLVLLTDALTSKRLARCPGSSSFSALLHQPYPSPRSQARCPSRGHALEASEVAASRPASPQWPAPTTVGPARPIIAPVRFRSEQCLRRELYPDGHLGPGELRVSLWCWVEPNARQLLRQ